MRPDAANRAFATFLAVCCVAFVLVGMGACMLLGIVAYRVQRDGFDALSGSASGVSAALVFLGLVATGGILGLLSLKRQWTATTELGRRVREHRLPLSPGLVAATREAGLDGRLDLIDSSDPFSFTYGVKSRRVALSRGLLETVSPTELSAVL